MSHFKKIFLVILLAGVCQAGYAADPIKGFAALAGSIPEEITELAAHFKINASPVIPGNYISRLPKGILLAGQTGIGKTSIARALSEELQCPFVYKKAADLDAKAIGELFKDARMRARNNKHGKTIVFIDDFDASLGGTLKPETLALLNEMDGFNSDESVIVIAATNRLDNFDKSLIRSGRFDKVVEISMPGPAEREAILAKFNNEGKTPFAQGTDIKKIARLTYNFTPADLKQLIAFAHILAKKENAAALTERHLLQAIAKVLETKGRIDKDLGVRIKLILNLLDKKQDEKKGFARLVGDIPDEIKNLVAQIKNDSLYKKFKLELPKGILLSGPPGTGKTSLVRALSEEAGCEFMAVSAAEFIDQFVGAGAAKIRDLFKEARAKAANSESKKTIIFIDEIDSIGKRQGNSLDATITELLTQMDGFQEDDSIMVIAASNHPSNIDPALLRPGRFNKIIKVGLPDLGKREQLLQFYTKGIPIDASVNLRKIAEAANNFSPADLKELVQKASADALKENSSNIKEKHFVEGLRKALKERILKGEKDIQQQLDALDVIFGGKDIIKGFNRIVGGVDQDILDLVKMIRGELDYAKFGLPFPKGILLAGPPGTGKTALVRALAEETGCEFIQAKGSEFIEKYVGVGAQRVRDLFAEARTKAEGNRFGKTIVFIDEIDAIGSRATSDNSETQRTVTELLTQMDGFYKDESVIVIGATNAPSSLDPALLRAGRFDKVVEVGLPDTAKRKALFIYYAKNRPVDANVSFDTLATDMQGCNAADIKGVVDQAAQLAMRTQQNAITQQNFEQAIAIYKAAQAQKNKQYVRIN